MQLKTQWTKIDKIPGHKDVVKLLLDYLDRVIELNAGDNNE